MDLETGVVLMEREPELAVLEEAVARDRAGSNDSLAGSFVLVRGEAGLGKTALLRVTRDLASRHGRLTFTARGSEIEQDFPFGIMRQLIEPWLLAQEEHARERLATGPAALAGAVFPSLAGHSETRDPDFATLARARAAGPRRGAAPGQPSRRRASASPEALELAVRCGATPLAQRVHTELKATGARPRSPLRTGIDALTPSELRVAKMAASGRSNPQIAQDPFVTIKTVETHLSRTYRKLSIAGRPELREVLAARR